MTLYFSCNFTFNFYNKDTFLNIQYKILLNHLLKAIVLTTDEYAFKNILLLYKCKKKITKIV